MTTRRPTTPLALFVAGAIAALLATPTVSAQPRSTAPTPANPAANPAASPATNTAPTSATTDRPIGEVVPVVETEPVAGSGDSADDAAIWINPNDPTLSRVIATDKKTGLLVYDLQGRIVQRLDDGGMNNVDVRPAFRLGGRIVDLACATSTDDNTIAVYAIDRETGRLSRAPGGRIETGMRVIYGLCMYRDAAGRTYVFVNDRASNVHQYRLHDRGGAIEGELVRSFTVGGGVEGMVADDELGLLYIGEEENGIWRYGAEPGFNQNGRRLVDTTMSGRLTADVEGLALAVLADGSGVLIASSQGSSTFAVYDRRPPNDYVGSFRIVEGNGIDAVSETDGIAATTFAIPPMFPGGLVVVQDDRNTTPDGRRLNQNFKYLRLDEVLQAVGR